MTNDLEKEIRRLRVENEVNKLLIATLIRFVWQDRNEEIDICKHLMEFSTREKEEAIERWSLEESIFFRESMDGWISQLSCLYDSTSPFLRKQRKRWADKVARRR